MLRTEEVEFLDEAPKRTSMGYRVGRRSVSEETIEALKTNGKWGLVCEIPLKHAGQFAWEINSGSVKYLAGFRAVSRKGKVYIKWEESNDQEA